MLPPSIELRTLGPEFLVQQGPYWLNNIFNIINYNIIITIIILVYSLFCRILYDLHSFSVAIILS